MRDLFWNLLAKFLIPRGFLYVVRNGGFVHITTSAVEIYTRGARGSTSHHVFPVSEERALTIAKWCREFGIGRTPNQAVADLIDSETIYVDTDMVDIAYKATEEAFRNVKIKNKG